MARLCGTLVKAPEGKTLAETLWCGGRVRSHSWRSSEATFRDLRAPTAKHATAVGAAVNSVLGGAATERQRRQDAAAQKAQREAGQPRAEA